MTDVGDETTVTFHTLTGATVTAVITPPTGTAGPVLPVPEGAEGTDGLAEYPLTFTPTEAGYYKILFSATGTVTAKERYDLRVRSNDGPPPIATLGDYEEITGALPAPEYRSKVSSYLRSLSAAVREYTGLSYDPPPEWLVTLVVEAASSVYERDPNMRSFTTGETGETYAVSATGKVAFLPSRLLSMLPGQAFSIPTIRSEFGPLSLPEETSPWR